MVVSFARLILKLPYFVFGKFRTDISQTGIKDNLRELCGIGMYNRSTPPGMFTACMGIALCK